MFDAHVNCNIVTIWCEETMLQSKHTKLRFVKTVVNKWEQTMPMSLFPIFLIKCIIPVAINLHIFSLFYCQFSAPYCYLNLRSLLLQSISGQSLTRWEEARQESCRLLGEMSGVPIQQEAWSVELLGCAQE